MKPKLFIIAFISGCIPFAANAQINGDNNWSTTPLFIDDFSNTGRSWNSAFVDLPYYKWRAHSRDSGVKHGYNSDTNEWSEHQVYQKENCVFNYTDQTMELISEYRGGPLDCTDFSWPPGYSCGVDHPSLYYFSGEIDANDYLNPNINNAYFKYGYFEIRCKLPVHRGAFPAFWLWGGGDHYEEIDIFEYSWKFTHPDYNSGTPGFGSSRVFTTGLYFNDNDNVICGQCRFARNYPIVPVVSYDLSDWHTFSCEWSPERLIWYFDGEIVNEHYGETVPYRDMTLKANYALDDYILDNFGHPITTDVPDKMTIDYIKVHKLKCDCENPATIPDTPTLNAFNYEVKESISIGSSGSTVVVPNSSKVVFRATDYIEITQNFELPAGSEMELLTHPCPE